MNRRLLWQITTPAVIIGGILFGACLVTAWYINQLENNLSRILSGNVVNLEAAQELEIRVRQLRHHWILYLIQSSPARLEVIEQDHQHFEAALQQAQQSASTPEEHSCIQSIQTGYQQYRGELAELRNEVGHKGALTDFGKLDDAHPIRHVTDPCHELFRLSQREMDRTAQESRRVTQRANLIVLFLGIGGPLSGLLVGYSVARGLSRSIYKLSVRLQDMAQHLEQDVASMSVAVDGDIEHLDQQLEHIVVRVEEVGKRLQDHQRHMLRAEQLAAVGQLAASVAHEVRNPLTTVKWLVETALRPQNPKPMTTDNLKVIHGAVARLEQLVQSFLDFARPPALQRSRTDLRAVIGKAVDLVRARARQQGIQIEVSTPEQPVPVSIDPGQFSTVLVNLFLNALDAMPRGGRVEVILEMSPRTGVVLSVRDTGPGIAAQVLDQPFTPFLSTKATGTGLGLSIARRIVEDHDGAITLCNRPEGGACCTIRLPESKEPAAVTSI